VSHFPGVFEFLGTAELIIVFAVIVGLFFILKRILGDR
jgi:hypothetical protein